MTSDKPIKITLGQARNFVLQRQLLNNPELPAGKAGTLRVIDRLGYVQIDTINVVERSHHLVLYTRYSGYKHQHLHELQAKDKKIFEYWAHAASFIPMKDYRFYLRAIERKPKKGSWLAQWISKHRRLIRKVKERIIKEGPLTSADFADIANRKRGTWWDWKPAKMALEVLFWQGFLMVKERRNFQRVYDLTERVLPENLDITKPSEDNEKKFFIRRALCAMGVASAKEINDYIGVSGKLNAWIGKMQKTGEIVEIKIEGANKTYFVLAEDLPELQRERWEDDSHVRLLSPFDNAIILRTRTGELFDFRYALECYVPKPKRKYGYFCLPMLWQNRLVGRIDPKADRQNKTLIINNLHLEDKNLNYNKFIPAFSDALKNFARFNTCEKIQFNKNIPSKIRRYIK